MLGRDKNRSTIKEKTTTKEKYVVPVNQVRQQIVQGTSLIGGTAGRYTNAQQYENQQRFTIDPNVGYTQDPYLKTLPGEQQFVSTGGKVETKIKEKITTNIKGTTTMPVQTTEFETSMPVGMTGVGTTMPVGTSLPVGTTGMQRKMSSSSSSSSNEQKNKPANWSTLRPSNVQTIIPPTQQPATYIGDMPIQSPGNIQTGYLPSTTIQVVNPIQSSIYRSSTERKGVVLGKNLYGQTGFASTGYSIQQPFPGQNVYVEEDPTKISEHTKEKFERSIM